MRSLFHIARKSILLWFGAAFFTGGLVCLSMGIQGAAQEKRYRSESRTVDAVALNKSIRPASHQENASTRYEITYRFVTDDGRPREGTDAVGVELLESLAQGAASALLICQATLSRTVWRIPATWTLPWPPSC